MMKFQERNIKLYTYYTHSEKKYILNSIIWLFTKKNLVK